MAWSAPPPAPDSPSHRPSRARLSPRLSLLLLIVGLALLALLSGCSTAAPPPSAPAAAAPTQAAPKAVEAPKATEAPKAAAPTDAPKAAAPTEAPKAAAATAAPQAAAPAAGAAGEKVLRIGINVPPGDFNSLTASNAFQYWALSLVMSQLAQADTDKLAPMGDLAESWTVAPDGTSVTFKLRPNAKWHDGQPVTAKDVAFTYTMALNPQTQSKRAGGLALIKGAADYTAGKADKVAGINVIDDHTIRFDMEFPNGLFVNETAQRAQILPEHILGKVAPADLGKNKFFQDSLVGSGPFKFVKYVPDQYLELAANPDYYNGKPKIDRVIISIIKSLDTMQVALNRGDVDFVVTDGGPLPTATYQQFMADPRFKIVATGGGPILGYGFNTRKDYLKDPRLHQAFLYGIDRKKIVQRFLSGVGTNPNSFLLHPWYQKPEWADMYPYDPEKAKALLAEMKWDPNRELTVNILPTASEDDRAILAAQQQMLADIGIKIKFQEMEASVWVDKFYKSHDYELAYVTYGIFPDPDGFLYWHLHSTSQNGFGYANPDLDKKIEAGRRAIDQQERAKIYQDINEEMLKTVPLAPVYRQNTLYIVPKRWSVPQVDSMTPVTSLDKLGAGKRLFTDFDAFLNHPETWDLK